MKGCEFLKSSKAYNMRLLWGRIDCNALLHVMICIVTARRVSHSVPPFNEWKENNFISYYFLGLLDLKKKNLQNLGCILLEIFLTGPLNPGKCICTIIPHFTRMNKFCRYR